MSLHEISLIQPDGIAHRVVDFWLDLELPGLISSGTKRLGPHETGDWQFTWLLDAPINDHDFWTAVETTLPAACGTPERIPLSINTIEDQNWLLASYRGFPPQIVGQFFIRGSHDGAAPVPEGLIAITLDAATAFGSGEHGTTRGCLLALCDLAANNVRPARVLDLGTGSGILAIAAAKLWQSAEIVAIDNDPESVKVAKEYAALNLAPMRTTLGDAPADGPYDLVIANILAGPLKELAPGIVAVTAPGGTIILSGLLDTQQDDVTAAYTLHGVTLTQATQIEDWMTLVLGKII
jgi:ribosomal protein L11 methyltransferase